MTTQVCLVGDRHLFMAGLARIVDEQPFEVVLQVTSLGDIPTASWTSGLIVMDGPEAIDDIESDIRSLKARAPGSRLVVIASDLDQNQMVTCFAAGVDGYLLEAISPEALRESLRLVMVGEHVFPSQLVALLCSRPVRVVQPVASAEADLSDREAEIVMRIAEGMPNKVIAVDLAITEATVKVHLKSILRKLGVTNRTQAAVWAVNKGLASNQPIVVQ
jgi:two-component system, NarL family, nitrate/nitrite response regulator NarL